MCANNTITTASSSSSGEPRRPTSFLNSKYSLRKIFISYTSLYTFSIIIYYPKDHSYTRLIIDLTNSPFLTYQEDGAEYRAQCATLDKLPRYLKLQTLGLGKNKNKKKKKKNMKDHLG